MTTTPDLIQSLVADAKAVRRLHPPALRAAAWLLIAAVVLALLAISHGLRPDLETRLAQEGYAVGIAASLLTGILAAVAAFMVSLPDRSRLWLLLPVPALAIWLSSISYECLTAWVEMRPEGIQLGEAVNCFATLVLTSVPLWLALIVMLRHVAYLPSRAVLLAGSLAVAALVASALSLFHSLDASAMILIWNLGSAALLVLLGSTLGGRMFSWVAAR